MFRASALTVSLVALLAGCGSQGASQEEEFLDLVRPLDGTSQYSDDELVQLGKESCSSLERGNNPLDVITPLGGKLPPMSAAAFGADAAETMCPDLLKRAKERHSISAD